MHSTRFERLNQPLAPRAVFLRRLSANAGLAAGLIGASLVAGMLGYHFLGRLAWIDAFQNAAMILSGMGPVDVLSGAPAKLFAGFYALYSGLALVATASLILAPVFHRVLHSLHVQDEGDGR
jgi:hypothetical protein